MTKNYLSTRKNIQKKYLNKHNIKKLSKNFNKIFDEVITDINTSGRTLNILNSNFKLNIDTKDLKKFKKFKDIALIGMGGSILGVKAINNFLEIKIKKKIHFFDNLDSKKILRFKKEKNLKEVLFLIISKSGDTIETLANLFTLDIIKNNSRNIIFISEKKNNTLLRLSKKFNLFYIEHRNYVGGRFSVLSEVGLIPAYLMGINIYKLRKNIKAHLVGKKKLLLKNSSIELANLLNLKKLNNLIFLNYSSELEHFLFWCQQLVAESLGKKNRGFLPVISTVPKDHHSLLQLYLDGPKDKLFYIFSIDEKMKEKINIEKIYKESIFLNNKTLNTVKTAQKNALIKTLKKHNIPFKEFKIKKIDETVLGELFSYFILETIIIGKLNKINPYDQPAVEEVKVITKKLLS